MNSHTMMALKNKAIDKINLAIGLVVISTNHQS